MTTYNFTHNGTKINSFTISGHSNFEDLGKDIVCAAVSSAALMACNTITEICNINAKITQDDGFLKLEINNENLEKSQQILQGLKLHLDELAKLYPQHIQGENHD